MARIIGARKLSGCGRMLGRFRLREQVRFCFEAAGLFLWWLTWFAFHHAPPADVRDCIHACTSSRRHAVTRADNFTGCGNSPDFTLRHRVAGEKGTMPGTSSDWRMKRAIGRSTGLRAPVMLRLLTAGFGGPADATRDAHLDVLSA